MEIWCDLEVDVNGQKTFWVNKSLLSSFCGKLRRLQGKKIAGSGHKNKLKLTFQDFPAGPDGFELITRFCYNKGKTEIFHSNILILHNIATYMEMDRCPHGKSCLLAQTEEFLQGFDCWTWSELLQALNQSKNLAFSMDSSAYVAQRNLVDELVRRLALLGSDPSSKCTSFRSSFDSRSTISIKTNGFNRSCWFFEDLSVLEIDVIDMVVNRMLVEKFDHSTISKFLFFYQKSRLFCTKKGDERVRILQGVINLLSLLNKRSIPINVLFHTLRKARHLKLSKSFLKQLELLIGSQLDQAAVDDLLVASPSGTACVFNVKMVIRLLKIFLLEYENRWKLLPLKRMGRLMDLYAMEIAPDIALKPSKFAAIVVALPDSARDSCDRIYHSIDMYFEVHQRIREDDKTKVASALNYDKLSPQVIVHLAQNINFPVAARFRGLIYHDLKLNNPSKCVYDHLKILANWWGYGQRPKRFKKRNVVEYVKGRDERVRSHVLKQMGLDFLELDRQFGRKEQSQISSKICCSEDVLYLPRLCS